MEHPSSVQRPASSVQRPASSISISIHQGSRCDPAASWYPDLPDPEIHRAHLGARTRLSKSLFAAMTSPAAGITFKVHPHQMPSLRQKARNDTMASRESGQWHASPIAQCHAKPDRGTEGPLASPRCADGGVENPASRRQKPSSSTGLGADGLLCDHWENSWKVEAGLVSNPTRRRHAAGGRGAGQMSTEARDWEDWEGSSSGFVRN